MNNNRMLIFLHVPKAGGSTLNHVLDWNYRHPYIINYYRQIPELIALSDNARGKVDCLRGQFFYGIHQYMPRPSVYITMLRHPVKRFISQYYYTMARRKRENTPGANLSIEQFLEEEPFQATMQLCLLRTSTTIDEALHNPLTSESLQEAKRNIENHFVVAGVMDYYDESLVLMKRALGWNRAYYARRNTQAQRSELPTEVRQRIEHACEPDLELYKWVKQRLEDTLRQQKVDFSAELNALRHANQRFESVYNLASPLRSTKLWKIARSTAKVVLSRRISGD